MAEDLQAIAEGIGMVNGNGGWTCDEAEAIARIYRAAGLAELADELLGLHCDCDEEEDDEGHLAIADGRREARVIALDKWETTCQACGEHDPGAVARRDGCPWPMHDRCHRLWLDAADECTHPTAHVDPNRSRAVALTCSTCGAEV